jgi:UDP-N-acetylmuramyl tripeptide synthase
MLALAIDRRFVRKCSELLSPRLVVSGTNGKTTTVRALIGALSAAGWPVVSNQAGSNLLRGVAAALAQPVTSGTDSAGVFEADEFALPEIVAQLNPHVVVLLNLFRDQLDRYGELETIRSRWRRVLRETTALVVANADDPQVSEVVLSSAVEATFFGAGSELAAGQKGLIMDVVRCPRCMDRLERRFLTYGHLGDYRCRRCGFVRPPLQIELVNFKMEPDWTRPATVTLLEHVPGQTVQQSIQVPLRGLHAAYNVAATCLAARSVGLTWEAIRQAWSNWQPAFGRGDLVEVGGVRLFTVLVKNPVGFSQALGAYVGPSVDAYVIAINDLTADGRDVSWLWDVDLEPLVRANKPVLCSGLRAEEMALRLKYAGMNPLQITVDASIKKAVDRTIGMVQRGGTVVVFPTYTALLELRRELHRRGVAAPFWSG